MALLLCDIQLRLSQGGVNSPDGHVCLSAPYTGNRNDGSMYAATGLYRKFRRLRYLAIDPGFWVRCPGGLYRGFFARVGLIRIGYAFPITFYHRTNRQRCGRSWKCVVGLCRSNHLAPA